MLVNWYIPVCTEYIPVHTGMYCAYTHTHTHILALLFQRKNKGRLPASGKDASHSESHVDADSVRSVSTLGWGEHFNSFSYFHHGY